MASKEFLAECRQIVAQRDDLADALRQIEGMLRRRPDQQDAWRVATEALEGVKPPRVEWPEPDPEGAAYDAQAAYERTHDPYSSRPLPERTAV